MRFDIELFWQVWSMKAPIWEFQYGDKMAKINARCHALSL
jgi:hypothetical protein